MTAIFSDIDRNELTTVIRSALGRDFTADNDYSDDGMRVTMKDPGGYLLRSLDRNPSNIIPYLRAAKQIQQDLGISFRRFTKEKFDQLYSLIALAKVPRSRDVIATLKRSGIDTGFSFAERTGIELEQDRSTIAIVAREIAANGYTSKSQAEKEALILQTWKEVRERQEDSFTSGPEVLQSPDKKVTGLKPIDILVVSQSNAGLGVHARKTQELLPLLNSDPSQKAGGGGRAREIDTLECDDLADLLNRCKDQEKESAAQGHHLVTFVILHAMPEGMGVKFKSNPKVVQRISFDKFRDGVQSDRPDGKGLDPALTSIFSSSCYSGEHADRLRTNGILLKNVHFNVHSDPNSIVSEEYDYMVVRRAYEKKPNGNANADINDDGHVTLGELKYYLDTSEVMNDPSSLDAEGRRLT